MATDTQTERNLFEGISSLLAQEDMVAVLQKIGLEDILLQAKAKRDARSLYGLTSAQFQKLWRQAHPRAECETIECDESLSPILFQYNLNEDKFVRMRADGIYITSTKTEESGDRYIKEEHTFVWQEFKVVGRYLVTFGSEDENLALDPSFHQEWHYNICLDGLSYYDLTEVLVKATLQTKFTGSSGRDYITGVLNLALTDTHFSPDITAQYRTVMGFTHKGWCLPDQYFFPLHDEISQRMYFSLKRVLARPFDKEGIKKRMVDLYSHTGIEHKDVLFAWAMYAPFSMALRDYYNLMVMCAMAGHGDRGKSPMAYLMSGKLYGHVESNIGDATLQSYSQCQSWMSSSTFPIVFDDCENLPLNVGHEIKSYTCGKEYMRKKGGGPTKQFYTVYKQYCANICMTFNKDPLAFADPFFRERSLYVFITKLTTDPLWRQCYNALQDGEMLQLLYDYTKSWKMTELIALMDSFDTEGLETPRNKTILRFMKFGAYLFKQLVGIDLNLSDLKFMIMMNNELNTVELVEALRWLYRMGRVDLGEEPFYARGWINYPLRRASYKDKAGYVLDLFNIRDIQTAIEGPSTRKWTLQMFFQKVCPSIFKEAVLTFVYAEDKLIKEKVKGIFIPDHEMMIFDDIKDKEEEAPHTSILDERVKAWLDQQAQTYFTFEDLQAGFAGQGVREVDLRYCVNDLLMRKVLVKSEEMGIVQYKKVK